MSEAAVLTGPAEVLPASPVREALQDAAQGLGAPAARLVAALTADYPRSVQVRPAALLRTASATAADLDDLLAAAGLLDLDELRRRAGTETGLRLPAPDLRFTRRADGGTEPDTRDLLGRMLADEQHNLARTVQDLHRTGALETAAAAVLGARRRFVLGDQKSAGYAALLASDLSASLARVTLIAPTTMALTDTLADVRAGDVLVAYCFRRYSRLTLAAAAEFRAAGGVVVGVSDRTDGPLAPLSDHLLVVATRSEAPTDSPTTVVAVGHGLAALASAGAKGAGKRLARRLALARSLDVYATPSTRHPAGAGS